MVLHEIGHGLGFTTFVDRSTGAKLRGFDDSYMLNLEDHSLAMDWPAMTDQQGLDSMTDTGDLHWIGPSASSNSGTLFNGVVNTNHIRMYAPDPFEPGSSVVHWDALLAPNELMEPFATEDVDDRVTNDLLRDIGWTISGQVSANNPPIPPNIFCSMPELDIPDGAAGGATDTLTIPDTALLANIAIKIRARHDLVNDLSTTLQHAGKSVMLFDQPLQADSSLCSGFDLNVTLWDDAADSAQNSCNILNIPALAGLLQPAEFLDTFDGQNLNGGWTLTIADNVSGNTGSLREWCILPISQGICDGANVSYSGPDIPAPQSLVCNVGSGHFSDFTMACSLNINSSGHVVLNGPFSVSGTMNIDMTP